MKKLLTLLLLSAALPAFAASPATPGSAPSLGRSVTTTINALDMKDKPLVITLHQGETWQLEMPDTISKIFSGRDDQVDVSVDGNMVFLKAVQNTGWGSLTIRLANGDPLQVVFNLASVSGTYIRRVVVAYPTDPNVVVDGGEDTTETALSAIAPNVPVSSSAPRAVSLPTAKVAPASTVSAQSSAPAPAPAWLSFGFTGGTRSGQSLTLTYSLTNSGSEALIFKPREVSMLAGTQHLPATVLGDQNGVVRVNPGQTVFGSLVVDVSKSVPDVPLTWSWIGSTLDKQRQYDVGGPLALVFAGGGHAR